MNRKIVAMEFPSEYALRKYLKEHPEAKRSNHRIVEKHPNGNIKNDFNVDGEGNLHGHQKSYHDNGQLASKGRYVNGRPADGIHTSYHENGKRKEHIPIVNGVIHGTKISWFSNGQRAGEVDYIQGNEVKQTKKHWDEKGKKRESIAKELASKNQKFREELTKLAALDYIIGHGDRMENYLVSGTKIHAIDNTDAFPDRDYETKSEAYRIIQELGGFDDKMKEHLGKIKESDFMEVFNGTGMETEGEKAWQRLQGIVR